MRNAEVETETKAKPKPNRKRFESPSRSCRADKMQLKARCKHTYWWQRLHKYFMLPEVERVRTWYMPQQQQPWVCGCVHIIVTEHANQKCSVVHSFAWSAAIFSNASNNCYEFSMHHRVYRMKQLGWMNGSVWWLWRRMRRRSICWKDKASEGARERTKTAKTWALRIRHYAWLSIEGVIQLRESCSYSLTYSWQHSFMNPMHSKIQLKIIHF